MVTLNMAIFYSNTNDNSTEGLNFTCTSAARKGYGVRNVSNTTIASNTLQSIQFKLSSSSSDSTPCINASIYNSSGTLVEASNSLANSDLPNTADWVTFTFATGAVLSNGDYVMVVCENANANGIVMQRYTSSAIDNVDNANNTCPTITFATNVQVPVKMDGSAPSTGGVLLPPPPIVLGGY